MRVQGFEFRASGLEFRVQDLGFRVRGVLGHVEVFKGGKFGFGVC